MAILTKEELLEKLHSDLTERLIDEVNCSDCQPQVLSVAAKFLADNKITAGTIDGNTMKRLQASMPAIAPKEDKTVIDGEFTVEDNILDPNPIP